MSVPPPGWVEPVRAAVARDDPPASGDLRHENRRLLDSRRLIARLVDWAILLPFAGLAAWEWGWNLGTFALARCLLLIYDHLSEVTTGASPGKRIMGLRVARLDDGELPTPRQAATRGVIGIVETGFIACVAIVATKQRRRLGDLAAGTAVVDARVHPIGSRPLFAGAVVYPVVWLIPALLAGSAAAKGTMSGTHRSDVEDICHQARQAVTAAAYDGGAEGVVYVLSRRDGLIARIHAPHAWKDRHARLMAALRAQTAQVEAQAAQARRGSDTAELVERVVATPWGVPDYDC